MMVKAARYYPQPKTGAEYISNYIAFWKGVEILKWEETFEKTEFSLRLAKTLQ